MFGYKSIKTEALDEMRARIDALEAEKKGWYAESESINEYLKIIAPQLKGVEMQPFARMSRQDIKEAYETIAPVMGVVNYIADNVGEVSRYLELRDRRTGEYVEKHWVLDLLRRPNDRYTQRKHFTALAVNYALFGDVWTYAPMTVGADRKCEEMYVIPGQRINPDRGGEEHPLKGVKIAGTGGEIDVEEKVYESFTYNLDDTSFFGTSKIVAAAVYLTVMDRAMNRQATTLKNGGPANLITPSASAPAPALPKEIDAMEQKFNASKNVNKNLAMRMALEVHKLGDNPADLSILSSHQDAINALCFVFKLPVDLYLGQAKYENAKEAKKTIYEQIAIPMCNEFAEDLLHYLELDGEYTLVVNTDLIEVLKESRSDTLTTLEKMHASVNELREANGYEAIKEEWADQPILPVGVQFGNEAGAYDINEI